MQPLSQRWNGIVGVDWQGKGRIDGDAVVANLLNNAFELLPLRNREHVWKQDAQAGEH